MTDDKKEQQELTHSEMITAMAHYYRAEVSRSLAWRGRIDVTTNWAVGATAAFLGFSFSNPLLDHSFFVFGLAITYILLYVEARRYRFYDAYEYRVKLLHQNYVYSILHGKLDTGISAPWREDLAQDLLRPEYKITMLGALALRVRAYYLFLFLVLIAGWLTKIKLHPQPADSFAQYLEQARFGSFPGWLTLLIILLFVIHLFLLRMLGQKLKSKGGRDVVHAWPGKGNPSGEDVEMRHNPSSEGVGWPQGPEPPKGEK